MTALQGIKMAKMKVTKVREAWSILMTGHSNKDLMLTENTEQNQTNSFWSNTANHQVFQIVQWGPVDCGVDTVFILFLLTIILSCET